jgi:hypothetical protein
MFGNIKFSGIIFFILFGFVHSNFSQASEKNISLESIKNTKINRFGKIFDTPAKEKNPVVGDCFDDKNKSFKTSGFEDASGEKFFRSETENREDMPEEPVRYKLRRGEKQINFEFGYSPFEPTHFTGDKEYNTAGRKLGIAAFRWGRVIGTVKGVSYEYMFEANPFAVSLKNEVENPAYISPTETPNIAPTKRETSYGVGITPVVFRFYFLPKSRVKPFAQIGAGILITNKPMPLPKTTWYNFMGYWGGGLLIHTKRSQAVTLAYRYLHISNANVTNFNPGYNANIFSVGYSFFYK